MPPGRRFGRCGRGSHASVVGADFEPLARALRTRQRLWAREDLNLSGSRPRRSTAAAGSRSSEEVGDGGPRPGGSTVGAEGFEPPTSSL